MKSASRRARSVIDSNLFVSGTILKRGNPFLLLEAWRGGRFTLLLSREQREELEDVLHRPQIQQRYSLSLEEVATLLHLLDTTAASAPPRRRLPVAVRDRKDEMILAAALSGRADYLVTGDDDLLVLRDDPRIGRLKIVTVREFLEILGPGQ
ncbi:MAG: putative toxin-antitoxin system toxin component, PIN family [Chloroflexi bacterium]|nr:putative toxin-antitoxin system toxin component, PIN family [Chloroflexota bacterium]